MMIKKHVVADEQLVCAYQTTPSAHHFDTLYQRYIGKVYRKCLSFTNDTQAAQDYTQDIFLKVFHKLDSFERQSSFSTWLYAITHNYCLDQHRLSKRLPTQPLSVDFVQTLPDNSPVIYDTDEDHLRLLEQLVEQLPLADSELLRLKYEHGLSIIALSQRYQLTESALKMRLKRSRDRLRRLYDAQVDAA